MTKATLVLSDLCLVPVGESKPEIWATSDILDLIDQAQTIKPVNARMIWTRYRPQTLLAQELTTLAATEFKLTVTESLLGLRTAYPEALGEGLTVAELPDQTARAEIKALTAEVQKLLRSK